MKVDTLRCPACGATCHEGAQVGEPYQCSSCGSTLVLTDLEAGDQTICHECGALNAASDRACKSCGAALKAICPFCLSETRTDAVHCPTCGVDLQQARQRKQAWLEQKRQFDQERLEAGKQAEAASQKAQLEGLLHDLDEPERHPLAIYCLHHMGERAVEPLMATLTDEDADARFGAAKALGLIGDAHAIPGLVAALSDPEPAVRYWVLDALGKLNAEDAVEAIGSLLADKHAGVRERAEQVLREMDSPRAKEMLQRKRKRWPL